jgi:IclR family transcriptional regulator, acetate operon repressor
MTPKSGSGRPKTETMKTLAKTLSVLDLFTGGAPDWSVTEIGRTLGLPVATAHRIVRSLTAHGYLRRTARARYRLDDGALDLGVTAVQTLDIRAALHPTLTELAGAAGETVLLSVYDERQSCVRCIDRIEARHPLRLSLDIGECIPLHAGASSKAALARLDSATVEDVLAHPLDKVGPKTIIDPGKLRANLRRVRETGWAYSFEENDRGAWGVAAPILTLGGNLVGVIGIAAPTVRHSPEAVETLGALIIEAAGRAAKALDPRLERADATPAAAGRP